MTSPGVLFDVDGTLVDTNYLHAVTWWQAFREQGRDVAMSDLHRAIGMGGDLLVPHVAPGIEEEQASRIEEGWSRWYGPYLGQVRVFEKVPDLLRAVADRGLTVVLASSAKESQAPYYAEAIGASEVIAAVTTSGDAEKSKPEADILTAALEKGDVDPARALLVGDTVWDCEAAAKAGIGCIGLLCGGIPRQELEGAGAVAVYADPRELLQRLDDSPIAELTRR